LEACDSLEITFFRDKYPALDGLIHVTESAGSVTTLTSTLVAFQLKAKGLHRADRDTSIELELSDVAWMLSLPIPTALFVADLRVDGIYIEWITGQKCAPIRKWKTPSKEPTRTFTPTEKFNPEKFKRVAANLYSELLKERINYVTAMA
jgi:hypothetical protein